MSFALSRSLGARGIYLFFCAFLFFILLLFYIYFLLCICICYLFCSPITSYLLFLSVDCFQLFKFIIMVL